ncbi:MAG: site-specific DNA-methyltransferase [Promethearchaeota archaeon]
MKTLPPLHKENSLISIFGKPLVQLESGNFYLDRYFQAKLVKIFDSQENSLSEFSAEIDNQIKEILSPFYQSISKSGRAGDVTPFSFWEFSSAPVTFGNIDTGLEWRGKGQLSIVNHEYFKFYRFTYDSTKKSMTFITLLKKGNETTDRTQLQKMYFQPSQKDPFRVISGGKSQAIQVAVMEYRSLDPSQKATYRGKNIQGRLNNKTVKLWGEFVSGQETMDTKEISTLQSSLAHHINQFTKNHAFSIPIYHNFIDLISGQLLHFLQREWITRLSSPKVDISHDLGMLQSEILKLNRHISEPIDQMFSIKQQLVDKPPWILDNHYCITVDLLPNKFLDEHLDEILHNPQQVAEWQELFPSIMPLPMDQSKHLTREFFRNHPSLMIDTRYFSAEFQTKLTASIPQFEEKIEGWVIRSENRRALHALHNYFPQFRHKVDCIYTDPPYNTGNNEFVYRDSLGHANWLTMMDEILDYFPDIGTPNMNFFISIDDNEYSRLRLLFEEKWGKESLFGPIIVQVNKGGRDYLPIAKTHEFLISGSLNGEYSNFNELPKPLEGTVYNDLRGNYVVRELRNRNPKFNKSNRPNLFYPFYVNQQTKNSDGFCAVTLELTREHTIEVIPATSKDVHDCWRWSKSKVVQHLNSVNPNLSEIIARQKRTGGWNIYEKHRKTTTKPKSFWLDSDVRTEAGTIDMRQLFPTPVFDHPKPVALIEKCLAIGSHPHSIICDPFAGSGTTGHAVINLNHKDGGSRKYVLVERADYVKSVILPRLKKLTFAPTWKEGKPQFSPQPSPPSTSPPKKTSKIIQYFSLEQVEDVYLNTEFSVDREPISNSIMTPSSSRPPSDANLLATILQQEKPGFPSSVESIQYKLEENSNGWAFSVNFPEYLSKIQEPDLKSIRIPFYTYETVDQCLHYISLLDSAAAFMGVSQEECMRIFEAETNPAEALVEFCFTKQGFSI